MISNRQILIIGITSDIGAQLASKLLESSNKIFGTSRNVELCEKNSDHIFYLNLSDKSSIDKFIINLPESFSWDELIFCPATLEPIGSFENINIEQWINSFNLNFINQVYSVSFEMMNLLTTYINQIDNSIFILTPYCFLDFPCQGRMLCIELES